MTAVLRTFTWAALGALFLAWASCGDGDRGMGGFSGHPSLSPRTALGWCGTAWWWILGK